MTKVNFSLVLACYNEGPTFEDSVNKILSEVKKLKRSWEVIFVEENSTDDTREKVKTLHRKIANSKLILHRKTMGRGRSVRDGLKQSSGNICGYIDVDCEISPSYIELFIREIENGNDMSIATRFYEKKPYAITRFVSSKVYSFFVSIILKAPFRDTEAGFKFFRRSKILPVVKRAKDDGWFFDTEICMLAKFAGFRISQVPVLFVRREDKKSTVRLVPDSITYFKRLIEFRSKYRDKIVSR